MRFISFFLLGIILSSSAVYAAETPSKAPSDAVKNAQFTAKLSEILTNQKEILKQLADLKAELLIVKARATR